ncbi:MAG: hypothetical protein AB8G11_25395 [Saprospiraceae bacterium]
MKKFSFIFLFIFAINSQAQSQTNGSSFLNNTAFKVGYYGNVFFDNGINIGAEYEWKEKETIKEKRKRQKTITHQLLFNGSIGYSTDFNNQTNNGLSAYSGIIGRRTNSKRWQVNLELNPLGYYRSFLPTTFEVDGNDVTKVNVPGRSYYAPSIAFGLGRLGKKEKHLGWYLNFNCTLRTPYNAGTLPIFSLQYGHRFNFKK